MTTSQPDRDHLIELNTTLTEITAAWDATEGVDTNLGVDVQNLGERLCMLLAPLVVVPELPAALYEEVRATHLTLRHAVDHYEGLDEHDTTACVDIYELLPAALSVADRALGGDLTTPLAFPDWKAVAEPYADGSDPIERYVVTLVVGDDGTNVAGEVTGPKEAALAALNLTRDEQARSTVWHVYDRHTGHTHRYEQSEFDNVAGHDIAEVLADEAQATERGRDMDAIYVRAAAADAAVVGDTLVLPPNLRAVVDQVAAAHAATASARLTRTQVEDQYGHDLPEDMGDGPFDIFANIDPGLAAEGMDALCTVARAGDQVFCLTCEANGYLDGYLPTREDIQRWHRDL